MRDLRLQSITAETIRALSLSPRMSSLPERQFWSSGLPSHKEVRRPQYSGNRVFDDGRSWCIRTRVEGSWHAADYHLIVDDHQHGRSITAGTSTDDSSDFVFFREHSRRRKDRWNPFTMKRFIGSIVVALGSKQNRSGHRQAIGHCLFRPSWTPRTS